MIAPAQITDDEFRLFRDFIHEECGMFFADNKMAFLSSRIGKRLVAKSIGSFYRYFLYLKQRGMEQEAELLQLLDELTINETSFFRNRPQFEVVGTTRSSRVDRAKDRGRRARLQNVERGVFDRRGTLLDCDLGARAAPDATNMGCPYLTRPTCHCRRWRGR